jgi:hypothetical protein
MNNEFNNNNNNNNNTNNDESIILSEVWNKWLIVIPSTICRLCVTLILLINFNDDLHNNN